MTTDRETPMATMDRLASKFASHDLSLTLFSVPKAFRGMAEVHQRNAIGSWLQFVGPKEILLCGSADGTREIAAEFGLGHFADLSTNQFGTPLVDRAFSAAFEFGTGRRLMFVNADILLPPSFGDVLGRLFATAPNAFLGIGRRANLQLDRLIDWENQNDRHNLLNESMRAERESILCKDYFVYPRGWFVNVPAFAVGRGNWDNWMVYSAKQMGMQVVDLSPSAVVLHPIHDHAHVAGGQRAAYVRGAEAKSNQRLAAGRHWIRGSTAGWELTAQSLRRRPLAFLQWPFWFDLPRALRLGRRTL
jgi:hypothetical protein